jgi:hypothetical protein
MQVRVLKKSFIDNALRQEGEVFDLCGPRNTNVEPIDGSWETVTIEAKTAVIEAPVRKLGRPKMTKGTNSDGA